MSVINKNLVALLAAISLSAAGSGCVRRSAATKAKADVSAEKAAKEKQAAEEAKKAEEAAKKPAGGQNPAGGASQVPPPAPETEKPVGEKPTEAATPATPVKLSKTMVEQDKATMLELVSKYRMSTTANIDGGISKAVVSTNQVGVVIADAKAKNSSLSDEAARTSAKQTIEADLKTMEALYTKYTSANDLGDASAIEVASLKEGIKAVKESLSQAVEDTNTVAITPQDPSEQAATGSSAARIDGVEKKDGSMLSIAEYISLYKKVVGNGADVTKEEKLMCFKVSLLQDELLANTPALFVGRSASVLKGQQKRVELEKAIIAAIEADDDAKYLELLEKLKAK